MSKHLDELGTRLKGLEAVETHRKLIPQIPIVCRLDGHGFSKFTKTMERPFDQRMINAMVQTTKGLMEKTNSLVAFTQSDEISLVWYTSDPLSSIFFDGKIQKMVSVLASLTTTLFIDALEDHFGDEASKFRKKLPHFDARVFQVPSLVEAANTILWRCADARKNSTSMSCRHYFSHKAMHEKDQAQMKAMLLEKGIDFETAYPNHFKYGTMLVRKKVSRELTEEEMKGIPEKHRPTGPVERNVITTLDCGYFGNVKNRVGVIFNGEEPEFD